jgi:DNA-binding MarR family transcriptional regulator
MTNETEGTGSSGCTCLRLRKASRRVSQIYDRTLEPLGLTVTQFSLLGYVARFDGIGIGALASKLAMDPTTLTRNVGPLVRRGQVKLLADPDDQRSRRLHLTAAGRKAYHRAKPAWASAQREIDRALEDAGAATLNKVLDRVLERLAN